MRPLAVLLSLLPLACGESGPPPLTVEAALVGDHVDVHVTTAPGARVVFTGIDAPRNVEPVIADAQGKATLRAPIDIGIGNSWVNVEASVGEESAYASAGLTPTLRWRKDRWTECWGGYRCTLDVETGGKISMMHSTEGVVVASGGKEVTANSLGEASLEVDLSPYVDRVPLDVLLNGEGDEPWVPVAVELRFPTSTEGKLETVRGEVYSDRHPIRWSLSDRLKTIDQGGFQPQTPPSGDAMVIVGLDHGPLLVGTATSMAQVRWIARLEDTVRDGGSCGTYTEIGGAGQRLEVHRYVTDLRVTIHERDTGKQLDERVFRGSTPSCSAVVSGPAAGVLGGDAPEKPARRFAEKWRTSALGK